MTLRVGVTTDYVVHVRGRVTDLSAERVVVGDLVLPRQLVKPVVTISLEPPREVWGCDGFENCECEADHGEADQVASLLAALSRAHDLSHVGNFGYCADPLCRAVDDWRR